MSQLERKQLAEKKALQKDALSDWELRYAQAKLELKEKHYKVMWTFSYNRVLFCKDELRAFDQTFSIIIRNSPAQFSMYNENLKTSVIQTDMAHEYDSGMKIINLAI